jgi:hypothetical protein
VQLGAQIDGFPAIVCDTVYVGSSGEVSGREADLALATHYANELLLRLMLPPGLVASGTEEEQKKAAAQKPYSQAKITQLLEKVTSAYECNLVESTTIWLFEHNEIEAKKKIILAPGEGVKGEGLPEVGEVWGVEMGVSLGSGKVKTLGNRTTLHRRTATTYGLKRPTSRALLSEVVKKFGTFPFSLRQLEDEKAAKVGIVECVRGGVIRQYEVVADKNNDPVARLFTTIGKCSYKIVICPSKRAGFALLAHSFKGAFMNLRKQSVELVSIQALTDLSPSHNQKRNYPTSCSSHSRLVQVQDRQEDHRRGGAQDPRTAHWEDLNQEQEPQEEEEASEEGRRCRCRGGR